MTARRRLLTASIALVGVAVLAAAGWFFVLRDDGPSYPDAWDARVLPYVEVVEKERGLKFDHPVDVRFLDRKEFEKTVRTDREDLDKDDRKEIREATSLFRAFGLLSGDVDLFDAVNDASGSGTLAYYSFDDQAITIRGTKLSLAYRATLVHELTHALQDQKFAIGKRARTLAKAAEDGEPTTQAEAFDAIVEGDAERVADLYRRSLSSKQRAALEKAESADTDDTQKDLKDVPKVVLSLIGAPYALGQSLTEAVAAKDEDALDELFENPPPDDSVLLDPLKALDPIPEPDDLEIPSLDEGEKRFDSGQVGALVTYLILAERIPLKEALAASDAWAGDAYVGFERDGVACVRVDYAATSADGAGRLTSAFDRWKDEGAGDDAVVARTGRTVTFESCDPGTGAKLANDASTEAIGLLATRSVVGSSVVQSGGTVKAARCFSAAVIDEYSAEQLTDPEFGADDPAVTKRIQELALGCR